MTEALAWLNVICAVTFGTFFVIYAATGHTTLAIIYGVAMTLETIKVTILSRRSLSRGKHD